VRPIFHAWRDTYPTDPTGERAFTSIHKKTPRAANDAWLAWIPGR